MRKNVLLIALAAVFALTSTVPMVARALPQEPQQQEQMAKDVSGSIQSVDLEESKIVVKREDETEITLVLNEDTIVRQPDGEPATLAALDGMEGKAVTARFVEIDSNNVALSIQMVAD
ncbi:MAG: hypothetical protein PVJ49_18405 [Acidobacteriota bacterium]|jgi:hypothetical protein